MADPSIDGSPADIDAGFEGEKRHRLCLRMPQWKCTGPKGIFRPSSSFRGAEGEIQPRCCRLILARVEACVRMRVFRAFKNFTYRLIPFAYCPLVTKM